MSGWKVPVQSLIDHIKTAVDVDPWAKEMAEELLKEQPEIVRCKDCTYRGEINCPQYYRRAELSDDYFCADGKRQ
jgi:hypothetical protein